MTAERPGLRISEVSKACGIDAETLRALIQDDMLQGVTRSASGHVYLDPGAVPTYQDLVALLEQQFAHHMHRARAAHRRVLAEIEAIGNDIDLALENPYDQLGDDLLTFRTFSNTPDQTTLTSALFRLEQEVWGVRTYSDALRRARTVM